MTQVPGHLRRGMFAVGVALLAIAPPVLAQGRTPSLGLRIEPDAITLTLPGTASIVAEATDATLRLRLPGLVVDPATTSIPRDPYLKGLAWRVDGPDAVLELDWAVRMPFTVEASDSRTLITLARVFSTEASASVAPGLVYRAIRRGTPQGPQALHVLDAVLDPAQLRVAPALASARRGFTLAPTSRIASEAGAVAAINGAYFGSQGLPLGLLVIDGQVISGPVYARTALALGAHPAIERTGMAAYLELPDGASLDLDGVNQARWDDMVVVYTERYGRTTRTRTPERQPAFEAAVEAGGLVVEAGLQDLAIPAGGYVISAQGAQADWLSTMLVPGARVGYRVDHDAYWEGARDVLGAGPLLLAQGEVHLSPEAERFKPDITQGRAPRTGVGLTLDGHLLAMVVDGRQEHSMGMTLGELAESLRALGATEALNLDGGGSSTMVIDGVVMNRPSDGRERSVSNALVFCPPSRTAGGL